MSLSSPFIRRPIATTLLTAAVALAGVVAFPFLPVSPLPQVDFPTIFVQAFAARRESGNHGLSSVATPLEREFGRISGVSEMTGGGTLGQTSVTLQFDLSRSIDCGHAGRRIGHQRGAQPPADRPAEQSDLPKGEFRRMRRSRSSR